MPRSCAEAYEAFVRELIPLLEQHGAAIEAAAGEGCQAARDVLGRYRVIWREFTPEAAEALERALEEWLHIRLGQAGSMPAAAGPPNVGLPTDSKEPTNGGK